MKTENHEFIAGQSYRLSIAGAKRPQTLYFEKIHTVYGESVDGEIIVIGTAYQFTKHAGGAGAVTWYDDDHIIDAVTVDAKPAKSRKPRKCQRCNGSGELPHLSHVKGGVCFGCGGHGELYE